MINRKLPTYTGIIVLLLFLGIGNSYGQFLHLKFDHITSENGLPHSTIHGIAKDKFGFMWFGTWSGLCRHDGYNMRVYRYNPMNPKSLINNRVHNILTDKKGDLWVATFDEAYICRYNYETDDFDRLPAAECPLELKDKLNRRNHRLQVNFSYQQTRWHLDNLSTTLVETQLRTGKQKVYTVDPGNPWSINDAYVSDIYLDDQQILWLGTYSNGVNRSYLNANPFHYLYYYPGHANSLIENTVRSIAEDREGNLWVGTRSKGITLVRKNGQYIHFQHDPADTNTIQNNYIKKLYPDNEGYVWIGSQAGLDRYNPKDKKIQRIEDAGLLSSGVYGMAEDADGDIWLATWNGLSKFNRRRGKIEHFELEQLMSLSHIWSIFIDSKGQIWAGTEGAGVFVFREDKQGQPVLIRTLQHKDHTRASLSDNRIYGIFEDRDRQIWIGTGNGLDCYDPATGHVKQFAPLGDLWPKGTIAGITEDREGYIWISHKQGISRIDKHTLDIRTFSKQDGLQSNEFSDGAVYRNAQENRLYFGGNKGINYFCPDSIRTNKIAPKVVLTELRILNQPVEVGQAINDRVVLNRPLYLSPAIDLTHADKSISIEFAALHFVNPAGNHYAYMLKGFDEDWIYVDANKRVASYSNLAPGDYTFMVKASNSDGVWNEMPTTLAISVAPALWASTGAYIVYLCIILLLLYAFYYYITRYTKLKSKLDYEAILHEKERELHESKVQFFTNISHEIKTPLSLILSPIQQLKTWGERDHYVKEQIQTMETNGQQLLKTVNQLLDIRRFETGNETLFLENTDVVSLVNKVVSSFAQQARQKKTRLKVVTGAPALYVQLDADKIEKVLYNLLSNALKFTDNGGTVKIRVQQKDGLLIDVIDDGKGIAPDDLERIFKPFLQGRHTVPGGSGLGLSYSKMLVDMHGGQLTAESRWHSVRNKLTVFHVVLPLIPAQMASSDSTTNFSQHEGVASSTSKGEPAEPQQPMDLPRRCSLLLVEDNAEMRSYLAQFFRKDYDILEAQNGEQGLAVARQRVPDLIISDVMMPLTDGISFTRQVKADTLLRHIPVILLTARTLVEYEVEGLETGADDYMVKPFHLPVLALKVRNLLLTRFHMQEKFRQQFVTVSPAKTDSPSPDDILLQKVSAYLEEHLQDADLKIEDVCQAIGLSRAQLYRKMKALTGCSMNDLIRELRLKRAQQLLRENKFQINEIAYMVGFNDPEYFRKSFKAKVGCSPRAFAQQYPSSITD